MSTIVGFRKHRLISFVRIVTYTLVSGCLLVACGSGNGDGGNLSDRNFVESANGVCTHYNMSRKALRGSREGRTSNAYSIRFLKEHAAELARLQALVAMLKQRPITMKYQSDLADEVHWIAMVRMGLEHRDVPYSRSLANKLRSIRINVEADERVLGLAACITPGSRHAVIG